MPTVLYEKKGHVSYVTLNRPEVLNAINSEMREELEQVWFDFEQDPDAWVAIMTGAGRGFSAGGDLRARDRGAAPTRPAHSYSHRDVMKPIICGINGPVRAAGMDMMLPCDIRVAADVATFGMTMTSWGVMASTGASQLPRSIRWANAMELLMTAEPINAQEAYRIGLVNKVVPLEKLMETCDEYAAKILRNSPTAIRLTKEAAVRGRDATLAESLHIGSMLGRYSGTTEDSKEGPKAFTEKRKPNWKNH
ncbi:MAG: enoyl-CoA hydratase/isomerase family protein [Dehalococcoidia bacterium]|nr:enoyl-CoA hydratase/isomerase family protein [Dehalococcoidia bacterium]